MFKFIIIGTMFVVIICVLFARQIKKYINYKKEMLETNKQILKEIQKGKAE